MKKIFISLFSLFLSFQIFAQVPLTISYNGNDITNQTIHLKSDETMYLPIYNNGSADMAVTIDITEVTVPHKAAQMLVCWENCYNISSAQSIGTRQITAGNNSGNSFDVTYNPDGNTSPASITFHIYEDGNPSDYITLTLDTETVGINDINKSSISIFPNPASDFVNVNIPENIQNPEISISNIIGKTVYNSVLNDTKNNINIKNLPSGIYFVSVISNGAVIDTKKLIKK